VSFGFYDPEGGTTGSMRVAWYPLDNRKGSPYAKLECFEDAFHALGQFTDVISKLAEVDGEHIQPTEFCQLLTECGFKDLTEETHE